MPRLGLRKLREIHEEFFGTIGELPMSARLLRAIANRPKPRPSQVVSPQVIQRNRKLAAASFPNDNGGYVRVEKSDKPIKAMTPKERLQGLSAMFESYAPTTQVQRQGKPRRKRHYIRLILGKRCRVHEDHILSNEFWIEKRREMPQDLSVNAVSERRRNGLDAFGKRLMVAA